MADLGLSEQEILERRSLLKRPPGMWDNTLGDAKLEKQCPLDNGRHATHRQPGAEYEYSAGQLHLLPLELITDILLALDIPSLTTFRRVNRCAMNLVDSLRQCRMILEHCPNVLRAILSVRASSFNCRFLYATLTGSKRGSCHRFGGYVYLITCQRVCHYCFCHHPDYMPVPARMVRKVTNLSESSLDRIPHAISVPGRYTPSNGHWSSRIPFLDMPALLQATQDANSRLVLPPDFSNKTYLRYMFISPAPYFSQSGQTAEWGLYCQTCMHNRLGAPGSVADHRSQYTTEEFWAHYKRGEHGVIKR